MTARVLVVDDLAPNVKLLEAKLTAEYFDVLTAMDGPSALEMARRHAPDIVLLDVMMPGMSGEEVCAELRRDQSMSGVHIIILTAKGQATEFAEGLGPDEYLTKPFDPDHIVDRAASILGIELDFDV